MKKRFPAVIPVAFSTRVHPPSIRCIRLVLLLLTVLNAPNCFSAWIKTIRCPAGHVYRDVRKYAGREEFCEIVEPGFLSFKDGAYKFWYSEGHPGSIGGYSMGREVGDWTECDRFDHCRQHMYPAVYPREKPRRGFKNEVPLSYHDGNYVMDFGSCRSTWVKQTSGSDPVSLNILGDYPYRCQISYIPQSVLDHDGKGGYVCFVPFDVGLREFASLDLRKEFPLLGLPQFCNEVSEEGEPLMIRANAWNVVTSVDVQCATIRNGNTGGGTFEIKLNHFASDLVRKVSLNPKAFNTLLCLRPITNPRISVSDSGDAVLTYMFSSDLDQAADQERCVSAKFKSQIPCP